MDDKIHGEAETAPHLKEKGLDLLTHSTVNASGHEDSLQRQYHLIATFSVALTIDSAWTALGGSLAIAIGMGLYITLIYWLTQKANGGPAGVLYEYLVACFCYLLIGASLAEVS